MENVLVLAGHISPNPEDYTSSKETFAASEHYASVGRLMDARRLELHADRLLKEAAEHALVYLNRVL